MYSLGPAGTGAIAGALAPPVKSRVAPPCGPTLGLPCDCGGARLLPEIIRVSSPAGFGGTGLGFSGAAEPLKSWVKPPLGAGSGGIGETGADGAGCVDVAGVLKSSVKPLAPEPEKGVGAAGAGSGAVGWPLNNSVNRPVPG